MPSTIRQIVSGGQTGVDRAALDAAIFFEIAHGGWCPLGRRSESGPIPDRYQLKETSSRNYAVRTRQNVKDSDGTLILYEDSMSRGTELTAKVALRLQRPMIAIDISGLHDWSDEQFSEALDQVIAWIAESNIAVLNIAGPRESTALGIGKSAEAFLLRLLESGRKQN